MIGPLERAVAAWLRRVAPPGWSDCVEGDLNEERVRGARRLWTLLQLTRIAMRFTAHGVTAAARRRNLPHQKSGGRSMTIGTDIRHAVRALARTPVFSLVAIATLAIAIGANTAIYSALSTIVLRPLPFADSHRYVFVWHKNPEMNGVMVTPPRVAIDQWRRATHVFEHVQGFTSRGFVMIGNGEPEQVNVRLLRPSTLGALGITPTLGRPFVEADMAPGAPLVTIIGHRIWTSRFGADPSAVGKTITLGDKIFTIIGVMPKHFALSMGDETMWAAANPAIVDTRSDSENTLAKLAPGVSVAAAQAALDAMPDVEGHKGWKAHLMTPAESNGDQIRTALFVLAGAVGLLLLIACVNVAGLMLSRNSGRRREVAVRHALGASRARLMRYLLIESALLAAAGGVAGLLVARGGLSIIGALRPRDLTMLERLELDPQTMWFGAAMALLTGLLFGAGPAVTASRVNLQDALKAGGRGATGGGMRMRAMLTVAQVALALMLLIGAAVLLKSYGRLTSVDPGYDTEGLVAVQMSLPGSRYPVKDKARRQAFFDQTLASVQGLPGVQAAAMGSGLPPALGVTFGKLEIEGAAAPSNSGVFASSFVTPTYFSTLGIPLLEGRPFTDQDTPAADRVIIVSRSFAQKYWPGQNAVGRRMRMDADDPWHRVVGVAGDVKALSLATERSRPQLYYARGQSQPGFGSIIVRATGDPRALIPAVKQIIWAQDPLLPLPEIATAEQILSRATGQSRFNLTLLAALAVCGLVLAIVGVYGVTAIFVGQRQREVGIRMALGATRAAVARLVLRQTVLMLALALTIGMAGAWWLSKYLENLVFQTATRDAMSFGAAAAGIAAAAFAATVIPLRRATTVDPATVLRAE